jgi:hypothetical protein
MKERAVHSALSFIVSIHVYPLGSMSFFYDIMERGHTL